MVEMKNKRTAKAKGLTTQSDKKDNQKKCRQETTQKTGLHQKARRFDKKQLLLIGIAAFLFSCSSPMDKKFNEETAKDDIEAIKSNLDSTELQLLGGSMIRLKFQDKKLEDMTYSEIL